MNVNCSIYVYNGTFVLLNETCETLEDLHCYDATPHFPDASVELGVNIRANSSELRRLYVDYVYVNVSYEKYIKADYWNLTNSTGSVIQDGSNLSRSDVINASAHWNLTSSIDMAWLEHNGTGNFTNYTITGPYTGNWTNYTMNLSDVSEFPRAGRIYATIYANETYGWVNKTEPSRWFYLWGFASVVDGYLSDSLIYNGTSTLIHCRVVDSNSSAGIEGYTVSFYNETDYIGFEITNSSGWAVWYYTDQTENPDQTYNLTCNITDQSDLYYYASSENYQTMELEVVDLSIIANVSSQTVDFGEDVTIIANISTDGSSVDKVWANITYMNITSGVQIKTYEIVNLTLDQTLSDNEYVYDYDYSPPRSGEYNVTVFVNASRVRSNTTDFNVSSGNSKIKFVSPNYRIMHNQTFNLTVNITAKDGDLLNANVTLNITNQSVMNITSGETWSDPNSYNITNGTTITLEWKCTSLTEGLTNTFVNVTAAYGMSDEYAVPFSVLKPIVLAEPNVVNISGELNMTTKIIGNTSKIDFVRTNPDSGIPWGGCDDYGADFVKNESECVGTGAGIGNIAPDANETCDPSGDCYHVNDEDDETSWTAVGSGKWVNLTLDDQYVISEIEIEWKDLGSDSNVTIYYTNETGGLRELYSDVSVPDSKNITEFYNFLPFQTDNLFINQTTSSTLVVYEMYVYTIEERIGKCYIYVCPFESEYLDSSGDYYVNVTVYTEEDQSRNNFTFLVNYGWPQIVIKELIMVNDTTDIYEAKVKAINGDMYDLDVLLDIENKSVVNLTTGSWNLSSSVIYNGLEEAFQWNVSSLSIGSAYTNVSVNSTTNKGYFGVDNWTVDVVSDPGGLPNLTSFWIEYNTTKTNKSNLFTGIKIFAHAYDDVGMKNVKASLNYPGGGSGNGSFEAVNSTFWEFEFGNNDEGINLNTTGNYTVEVIAIDVGGQEKYSGVDSGCTKNYTLVVFNNYTLTLENFNNDSAFYNRGENLTVKAYDVNGFLVKNVSWQVNLTKYGQGIEELNGTGDIYDYPLNSSDPVGNYTFVAKGEKNNNTGEKTWEFNVSKTLSPVFIAPSAGSEHSANSPISPIPQLRLYNKRNDLLSYEASVMLVCPNGQFSLGKIGDSYYNISANCRSSSSSGITFYLTANSTDSYNNTGTGSLQLKTSTGAAPPGNGGGSAPIMPSCVTTPKNCSDGIDNDCDGLTDCGDPDCDRDPVCIVIVRDFNFTIERSSLEIIQGENGTFIGSLSNMGNAQVTLFSEITKECCEVFVEDKFVLPVKSERDFSMVVYVPLFTEVGEYLVSIKTISGSLEKAKTLSVMVKENPFTTSLTGLEEQLPEVELEIGRYGRVGIDVYVFNEKVRQFESNLEHARYAINEDDLNSLREYVSNAEKTMGEINSGLTSLMIQKFLLENKWNILLGLIVLFLTGFFSTQVIAPYIRVRRDIKKLMEGEMIGEKTKASAEEQYFTRQIDRKTFENIMTEEQDKVLGLRSTIEERRKEMHDLLNVKNILGGLFRFPLVILKRLRNAFKRKPKKD